MQPNENSNIYNPSTGQYGYQIPGAGLMPGWQWWSNPNDPNNGTYNGAGGRSGDPFSDPNYNPDPNGTNNPLPQQPGESMDAYRQRILNSPFYLAGGNGYGKNYGGPPSDQDLLSMLIKNTSPTAQINLPQTGPGTPGVGGIDGFLAYLNSWIKSEQEKNKDSLNSADQNRTNALATQQQQIDPYLRNLLGAPTNEQNVQTASDYIGFNAPNYFQQERAQMDRINTTNQQLQDVVTARDNQISQTNDKLASMNFINNQQAQIRRNAEPEVNRLTASTNIQTAALAAMKGYYSDAQNFINQFVDARAADRKNSLDNINAILNTNKPIFDALDSKYQTALTDYRDSQSKGYDLAKTEATQIGSIIMDAAKQGVDLSSYGNRSLQDVQQAYAQTVGNKAEKPQIFGSDTGGYYQQSYDKATNSWKVQPAGVGGSNSNNPVKLSSTQLNGASSLLGITPQAYKGLDPQVQTYFTTSYGKSFMGALQDLRNGKDSKGNPVSYDDIKSSIQASNQPQQVKDFLQQQLDKSSPQGGNQGSGFWAKLGNWFQGGGFQ